MGGIYFIYKILFLNNLDNYYVSLVITIRVISMIFWKEGGGGGGIPMCVLNQP